MKISSKHHSQTVKARELKFWEKVHLPPSHVCCFLVFLRQISEACRWRVCYQRGLHCLVSWQSRVFTSDESFDEIKDLITYSFSPGLLISLSAFWSCPPAPFLQSGWSDFCWRSPGQPGSLPRNSCCWPPPEKIAMLLLGMAKITHAINCPPPFLNR